MKHLFFVLFLSTIIYNANAQGGPTQDPFPANSGVFPAQGYLNRQYQWSNDYMSIGWFSWVYTNSEYPDHENILVQLINYTDEEMKVTVTVREMGIEKVVIVPPFSDDHHPIGRIENYSDYEKLLLGGVHLFANVSQPNYHFNLGTFYYKPAVWNAPGGGYPKHKKDLQY